MKVDLTYLKHNFELTSSGSATKTSCKNSSELQAIAVISLRSTNHSRLPLPHLGNRHLVCCLTQHQEHGGKTLLTNITVLINGSMYMAYQLSSSLEVKSGRILINPSVTCCFSVTTQRTVLKLSQKILLDEAEKSAPLH